MRRLGFLLLGAAIGLSASPAHAQQARAAASAPAAAAPPEEPLYNPAAHAGIPEAAWLRMTRGTGRRSTGMMATGIVFVGLGVVFMGTGTAVYAVSPSCAFSGGPTPLGEGFVSSPCSRATQHGTGMAMLVAGTIGVALGIPLWVVGASDVPWAEAAGLHAPATPRPTWAAAAAVPALTSAPGGAGLAWRF